MEERGVPPTEDRVRDRLGGGVRFERHLAELEELYGANRDDPTIALKRDLWRSLLAAALGQVVEEEPDLDRLFVRHTYLSVVVGLAVQAAFGIPIESAANNDPVALLGGQLFVDQTGVSGVVESDFFTWPAEVGGDEWIRDLAKRIGWFDWNEAESDIARILYESVIPADDRRRLGEYYTPDWLAREIVDTVVTDPLNQRVLDPACGSGSFIFAAVRKYLTAAKADGRSSAQAVEGLLDHVIGIDVHPVAVHLARATWTLAARDALMGAVDEGSAASATVPVYLGDSLQLRTDSSSLFGQSTVTIQVAAERGLANKHDVTLEFPRGLVEKSDDFDNLMTRMADAIENGEDPAWELENEELDNRRDRRMMERTAKRLKQLHDEGRDHIWAYYTRNLVRPVALRAEPVDVIVGNPPWIPYNRTEAIVREELQRQSKVRYQNWARGHYKTHNDIAAMFFTRCVELYLRVGGLAGMVLPHSVLQSGHYNSWRTGSWGVISAYLDVRQPWDLEKIEPNDFFPMTASVVFLQRAHSPGRRLPETADRWLGPPGGPFAHATAPLVDTSGAYVSQYGKRASQGATIVPRVLFFVNPEPGTASVQAAKTVTVSPRRSTLEKTPWKELAFPDITSKPIEQEYVYDIHLGETVAPYALLEPLKAVLPLSAKTSKLERDPEGWYGIRRKSLKTRMRRRWRLINGEWETHKSGNNKLTLLEELDFMSKLENQREYVNAVGPRVVYSSSGRPTAGIVDDPDAIIDYTLFWINCRSRDEANYLTAVINSQVLASMLLPLMPKGLFGGRHVQKHLWRLPIPEFDSSVELHQQIALAGDVATAGVRKAWREARSVREEQGKATGWRTARSDIRRWLALSEEGQRVEELVSRLLRD